MGLEEGEEDVRADEGRIAGDYDNDGCDCGRLLYLFAITFNLLYICLLICL